MEAAAVPRGFELQEAHAGVDSAPEAPSPAADFDTEGPDHAAYAQSRTEESGNVYVKTPHQKYLGLVNGYCDGICITAKPPCLIYGPRGCGKTALVANWLRTRKEKESLSSGAESYFAHFVTTNRDSLQLTSLLSRLYEVLKRCFRLRDDVPSSEERLRHGLARFMQNAVRSAPTNALIIVIDAVDELRSASGENENVRWLPTTFPPQIRVILTATTSLREQAVSLSRRGSFVGNPLPIGSKDASALRALARVKPFDNTKVFTELQRRECVRVEMSHVDTSTVNNLLQAFQRKYAVDMDTQEKEIIRYHPPCRDHLYLRVLMDSLRSADLCSRLEGSNNAQRRARRKRLLGKLTTSETSEELAELALEARVEDVNGSGARAPAEGSSRRRRAGRSTARPKPSTSDAAGEGKRGASDGAGAGGDGPGDKGAATPPPASDAPAAPPAPSPGSPAPMDGGPSDSPSGAGEAGAAHDPVDPRFFQYLLALLYVSRRGLRVDDLKMLLRAWAIPWPHHREPVVLQMLDDFTWDHDGRKHFAHEVYRRAVWTKCIGTAEQRIVLHSVHARFLLTQPPSRRSGVELPWHLERSGQWARLKDALVNMEMVTYFDTFASRRLWQQYWHLLSAKPGAGSAARAADGTRLTARSTARGKQGTRRSAAKGGHPTGRSKDGHKVLGLPTGRSAAGVKTDRSGYASVASTGAVSAARKRAAGADLGSSGRVMAMVSSDEAPRPCYDVVEEYITALDSWASSPTVAALDVVRTVNQIAVLLMDFGEAQAADPEVTQDIPDCVRPDVNERLLASLGLDHVVSLLQSHRRPAALRPTSPSLQFASPQAGKDAVVSHKVKRKKRAHRDGGGRASERGGSPSGASAASPSARHAAKHRKRASKKSTSAGEDRTEPKTMAYYASYYFRRWVWMQFPWMALNFKGRYDAERRRTTNALLTFGAMHGEGLPATDARSPIAGGAGGASGAGGAGGARAGGRAGGRAGASTTFPSLPEGTAVQHQSTAQATMSAAAATAALQVSEKKAKLSAFSRFDDVAPTAELDVAMEVGTRLDLGKAQRFEAEVRAIRDGNRRLRAELDTLSKRRRELHAELGRAKDAHKELEDASDFTREKAVFDRLNARLMKVEAMTQVEAKATSGLRRVLKVTERHAYHCDVTYPRRLETKIAGQRASAESLTRSRDRTLHEVRELTDTLRAMQATFRRNEQLHKTVMHRLRTEKRDLAKETGALETKKERAARKKRAAANESKQKLVHAQSFAHVENMVNDDEVRTGLAKWKARLAELRERTGVLTSQEFYNVFKRQPQRESQLQETLAAHRERRDELLREKREAELRLDELKFGQATPGILTTELRAKEDEIHEANVRLKADRNNFIFASNLVQQSSNGIRHLADLLGIMHSQQQPVQSLLGEIERTLSELVALLATHPEAAGLGLTRGGVAASPSGDTTPHPPALNLSAVHAGGARGSGVGAPPHETLHAMLARSLLNTDAASRIHVNPMRPTSSEPTMGLGRSAARVESVRGTAKATARSSALLEGASEAREGTASSGAAARRRGGKGAARARGNADDAAGAVQSARGQRSARRGGAREAERAAEVEADEASDADSPASAASDADGPATVESDQDSGSERPLDAVSVSSESSDGVDGDDSSDSASLHFEAFDRRKFKQAMTHKAIVMEHRMRESSHSPSKEKVYRKRSGARKGRKRAAGGGPGPSMRKLPAAPAGRGAAVKA